MLRINHSAILISFVVVKDSCDSKRRRVRSHSFSSFAARNTSEFIHSSFGAQHSVHLRLLCQCLNRTKDCATVSFQYYHTHSFTQLFLFIDFSFFTISVFFVYKVITWSFCRNILVTVLNKADDLFSSHVFPNGFLASHCTHNILLSLYCWYHSFHKSWLWLSCSKKSLLSFYVEIDALYFPEY